MCDVEISSFPWNELFGGLVLKVLEMNSLQPFNCKREAKVSHWGGYRSCRKIIQDVGEINILVTYGHNEDLLEVLFRPATSPKLLRMWASMEISFFLGSIKMAASFIQRDVRN
jgi:hypothetical protein